MDIPSSFPSLAQKVAIVTGATSGIGKSIAISLAKEGCYLTVTGRDASVLQEVVALCCQAGLPENKVLAVPGDLSKDDDCKRIVEATVEHFKRLHILINNAGILVRGTLETLSMDDYDRQFNVNTRSVVLMMKLVLPHILATKGNIVNVSSNASIKPVPGYCAYNMSKAAIDQLTKTVALEVADRGVRVNAVNPAVIKTEIHKRAGMDEETYRKHLEFVKSLHPVGRVGEVEEVSQAVLFLASDSASFITGVTLLIDGGLTIA